MAKKGSAVYLKDRLPMPGGVMTLPARYYADQEHFRGMAKRITINISLTPEFEKFVEAEVASGRYQSASEVFREGLRLLQEREEKHKVALDEVRKKVRQGLEAAKRGELFNGEEVLRDVLSESRRRREARAK